MGKTVRGDNGGITEQDVFDFISGADGTTEPISVEEEPIDPVEEGILTEQDVFDFISGAEPSVEEEVETPEEEEAKDITIGVDPFPEVTTVGPSIEGSFSISQPGGGETLQSLSRKQSEDVEIIKQNRKIATDLQTGKKTIQEIESEAGVTIDPELAKSFSAAMADSQRKALEAIPDFVPPGFSLGDKSIQQDSEDNLKTFNDYDSYVGEREKGIAKFDKQIQDVFDKRKKALDTEKRGPERRIIVGNANTELAALKDERQKLVDENDQVYSLNRDVIDFQQTYGGIVAAGKKAVEANPEGFKKKSGQKAFDPVKYFKVLGEDMSSLDASAYLKGTYKLEFDINKRMFDTDRDIINSGIGLEEPANVKRREKLEGLVKEKDDLLRVREQGIDDNIAEEMQKLDNPNISKSNLLTIMRRLETLNELKGEIWKDPEEKIIDAVQKREKNLLAISSIIPDKATAREALNIYYQTIKKEANDLKDKNNFGGVGDILPSTLDFFSGYSDDRARFEALAGEVRALAPLVLLDRLPESFREEEGFGDVVWKQALSTFTGSTLPAFQTDLQKANSIRRAFDNAGVTGEVDQALNDLVDERKYYTNWGGADWGNTIGTTMGILPAFIGGELVYAKLMQVSRPLRAINTLGKTGKLVNPTLKIFSGIRGESKYFGNLEKLRSNANKTFFRSIEEGLKFELVGTLFASQEEEANFLSGAFGRAAATPIESMIGRIFGANSNQFINLANRLVSRGLGETTEEFAQETAQMYRASENGEQFFQYINEFYGNPSELFHFAVQTFMMGVGFQGGGEVGKAFNGTWKESYSQLEPEEKEKFKQFANESYSDAKAATNSVVLDNFEKLSEQDQQLIVNEYQEEFESIKNDPQVSDEDKQAAKIILDEFKNKQKAIKEDPALEPKFFIAEKEVTREEFRDQSEDALKEGKTVRVDNDSEVLAELEKKAAELNKPIVKEPVAEEVTPVITEKQVEQVPAEAVAEKVPPVKAVPAVEEEAELEEPTATDEELLQVKSFEDLDNINPEKTVVTHKMPDGSTILGDAPQNSVPGSREVMTIADFKALDSKILPTSIQKEAIPPTVKAEEDITPEEVREEFETNLKKDIDAGKAVSVSFKGENFDATFVLKSGKVKLEKKGQRAKTVALKNVDPPTVQIEEDIQVEVEPVTSGIIEEGITEITPELEKQIPEGVRTKRSTDEIKASAAQNIENIVAKLGGLKRAVPEGDETSIIKDIVNLGKDLVDLGFVFTADLVGEIKNLIPADLHELVDENISELKKISVKEDPKEEKKRRKREAKRRKIERKIGVIKFKEDVKELRELTIQIKLEVKAAAAGAIAGRKQVRDQNKIIAEFRKSLNNFIKNREKEIKQLSPRLIPAMLRRVNNIKTETSFLNTVSYIDGILSKQDTRNEEIERLKTIEKIDNIAKSAIETKGGREAAKRRFLNRADPKHAITLKNIAKNINQSKTEEGTVEMEDEIDDLYEEQDKLQKVQRDDGVNFELERINDKLEQLEFGTLNEMSQEKLDIMLNKINLIADQGKSEAKRDRGARARRNERNTKWLINYSGGLPKEKGAKRERDTTIHGINLFLFDSDFPSLMNMIGRNRDPKKEIVPFFMLMDADVNFRIDRKQINEADQKELDKFDLMLAKLKTNLFDDSATVFIKGLEAKIKGLNKGNIVETFDLYYNDFTDANQERIDKFEKDVTNIYNGVLKRNTAALERETIVTDPLQRMFHVDLVAKGERNAADDRRNYFNSLDKATVDILGKGSRRRSKVVIEKMRFVRESPVEFTISFINKDGDVVRQEVQKEEMTQAQGLQKWLEWQMDDAKGKFLNPMLEGPTGELGGGMGWSEESIEQLEKWLTPEMLEFGRWMQKNIYAKFGNDKGLQQAYITQYGVPLDLIDNYVPTTIDVRKYVGDTQSLLEQENFVRGLTSNRFIKRRVNNNPLAFTDVFKVADAYSADMIRFKHMSTPVRELEYIFKNKSVRETIASRVDFRINKALDIYIERFAGRFQKDSIKELELVMNLASKGVLFFNTATGLKQVISSTQYLIDMPVTDWTVRQMEMYTARPNPSGRASMLRKVLLDQPYFADRIGSVKGLDIGKQEELKVKSMSDIIPFLKVGGESQWVKEMRRKLKEGGAITLANLPTEIFNEAGQFLLLLGDKTPAIYAGGAYFMYKFEKVTGRELTTKDIKDFNEGNPSGEFLKVLDDWDILSTATQQSTRTSKVSNFRASSSWVRLITQFTSGLGQIHRNTSSAARNIIRGKDVSRNLKAIGIGHLLTGFLYTLVGNGFLWDDEEQIWGTVVGNFEGIPVFGRFVKMGRESFQGKPWSKESLTGTAVASLVNKMMVAVIGWGDGMEALDEATNADEKFKAEQKISKSRSDFVLAAAQAAGINLKQGVNIYNEIRDILDGKEHENSFAMILYSVGVRNDYDTGRELVDVFNKIDLTQEEKIEFNNWIRDNKIKGNPLFKKPDNFSDLSESKKRREIFRFLNAMNQYVRKNNKKFLKEWKAKKSQEGEVDVGAIVDDKEGERMVKEVTKDVFNVRKRRQ